MNKLLAILAMGFLPTGLSAEDPNGAGNILGTTGVLEIEESAPVADGQFCARDPMTKDTECMAFHRAVLTARVKRVSLVNERGQWM